MPYIRIPTTSKVSSGCLVLQAPPSLSGGDRSPGGVDAVYFEYVPVDDASITTEDFATLHRVLRAARATADGTDQCSTP